MSYALIENGAVAAYPYTYAKFRAANPGVSFPRVVTDEWLARRGIVKVKPSDPPAYDLTKNIIEKSPIFFNDEWVQAWEHVDATPEQIAERQEAEKDKTAREAAKADAFVQNFIAMTPSQVMNHIDANVTNLASAKDVIGKMALMLLLLARREFR